MKIMCKNMQLKVTILERTTVPLMVADKPWEDMELGFTNVTKIENTWHMWYESYDHNYRNDADGYLCYAYSNDGVHWVKPNLGLVDYLGSKDNNILISGPANGGVCGHTVFLDEQSPAAERFKIVFIRWVNNEWQVYGGTSSDGIHWNLLLDTPLLAQNSDTQNVCFRDGDIYRLYVRMWDGGKLCEGKRVVGYTESDKFGNFSEPKIIFSHSAGDPEDFEFYNSAATKVKDNLFIIFPSAYSRKTGLVLPYLSASQDGINFERIGTGPFLEFGNGFDNKCIYAGPGCVPGDKPGTYWFYYVGYNKGHDDPLSSWKYAGGIGRFLIKIQI